MDSGRMHETSWPEEYATGRLPAEHRVEFESHLVGCPECLDRVEAAERMQAGFQELERRSPTAATPPARRLSRPRWATRVIWAVAATAAVAVAVWSGVQRTGASSRRWPRARGPRPHRGGARAHTGRAGAGPATARHQRAGDRSDGRRIPVLAS
jgi:anti-sigma factor RsiW